MRGYKVAEFVDDFLVLPAFQPPSGAEFQCPEPLLVQSGGPSAQRRASQPVEGGPTPQSQSRPDHADG
ncbi:hypothetical protein BEH93_09385 [Streptomyces sp. 2R]|nr:hypothetical protein BEH93_09385 [Streptomyces sp. 2R]